MLNNSINGAVDGGSVNQGAHSVMNQDDVVRLSGKCGEGVRDGLLAIVAAGHDVNARGEAMLCDLGLDALHLRLAHGHVDRRDPRYGGERAERMNEDRNSVEREKLLGLRPGHSGSEACRWKNCENLHNGWSIQRRPLHGAEFSWGSMEVRHFPGLRIETWGTRLIILECALSRPPHS